MDLLYAAHFRRPPARNVTLPDRWGVRALLVVHSGHCSVLAAEMPVPRFDRSVNFLTEQAQFADHGGGAGTEAEVPREHEIVRRVHVAAQ
ncbi:hypothetical protein GCM10009754_45180 [Amycolatopsis minnesotensis]|uniref:Uncharacterized protein n=1 Tax=Amycolatopsis minnesotensis TaxID=337894 RepID=A0ABP5CRA0_9PSEU